MSNLLLLNFDSNINRETNCINLCWNMNFTSNNNNISIPNEINNNTATFRNLYLSYLDKLNDHFRNIRVDNLPYWLLSSITCKQGSFANPFEIKNAIKLIYLESFLKQNSYKKLILTGNVDDRIILILKTLLNNCKIEFINNSSNNKVNISRKYFSILKTLLKIIFAYGAKKTKNLNTKVLLIDYSSSNNKINYWSELLKSLNRKYVLKLNIDIDANTSSYSTYDNFKSIFLFNNFSFKESLKKYLKILLLYKDVKKTELFKYSNTLNLWPLYSELIFRDFIGSNALFNAITISSVNNLFKDNPNISLILYPRENQAWERILLFYNNNKSISIGNLHAGFKYWDLRNYLNESKHLKQNSMSPSVFSVYSKRLIDILRHDKNFLDENFQLVESLRLKTFKREKSNFSNFQGLLVILDYDTEVSIKQIDLVLAFMKKSKTNRVYFKAHINNHKYLSRKYKLIQFEKDNIEKLINSNSHFFCSNNTTLSIELISSGFNTSIMDSGGNLDMDPSKIYGIQTEKIKSEDDLLCFINSNKPNQAKDIFKLDNNFSLWKNLLKSVNKEFIVNQ